MSTNTGNIPENLERLTYSEFIFAIALSQIMSGKDFHAILDKPDTTDGRKDMAWRRLCVKYDLITKKLPRTGKQRDRENYLKARLDQSRATVKELMAGLKAMELKLSSHMVRAKPYSVRRRK